jgi:phage terminase large subunit-like protein
MTLPLSERKTRLSRLTNEELARLKYAWRFWARPAQLQPVDFANGKKTYWLIDAGRGFGKTRTGAETVRAWAKEFRYVNLIGATLDDARDIMIEGESGILAICPNDERPRYVKHERLLLWPTGCKSLIFTADEPERLRGKQHQKAWADELAAWRYAEAWDQLKFGLRIGKQPQAIITTTPRPSAIIKELLRDPDCAITTGTTYDNADNLAPAFFRAVIRKYEGTRLGRQELNAELLADNPNALWTRADIDNARITLEQMPALQRCVIGVDPAVTSTEDSDETGIVACGIGPAPKNWIPPNGKPAAEGSHFYVTQDASLSATPDAWARAAIKCYHDRSADRVIGETNNGGDLIEALLRTVDANVSYTKVTATRGKMIRAEPIAALYEQGRVHHVGAFATLEDQMCDYDPITATLSPDRMDALVWALSALAEAAGFGILDHYARAAAKLAANTVAPTPGVVTDTHEGLLAHYTKGNKI